VFRSHGLAIKGHAPAIFARTNSRGVPVYALGLSSLICCIAFLSVSSGSRTVFLYFVNLVSIFGLLTWISILVSHIYFIRARRAQGVPDSDLRYVSPFGLIGSVLALIFCIIIAFTKNFGVFLGNTFDYQNFITGYLGIPLYLIMIFGWKFAKKTKGVKPHEADLWSGKDVIDRDEKAWILKEVEDKAAGRGPGKLYQYTLGWLF
jgi:amino acid transporter